MQRGLVMQGKFPALVLLLCERCIWLMVLANVAACCRSGHVQGFSVIKASEAKRMRMSGANAQTPFFLTALQDHLDAWCIARDREGKGLGKGTGRGTG